MELDWKKYLKCFLKHKKGTDLYDSGRGLLRCPKAHTGTYLVQKRFGMFILGSLILAKCLLVIHLPGNWIDTFGPITARQTMIQPKVYEWSSKCAGFTTFYIDEGHNHTKPAELKAL